MLDSVCEIYDSAYTICNGFNYETGEPFFNGSIFGYTDSTAQAYAEKYGYSFESLGESSVEKNKLGDIDGDGAIDSSDASAILAEYAATQTGAAPTLDKNVADVNDDGFVDASDASTILSYYAFTMSGGVGTLPYFITSNN